MDKFVHFYFLFIAHLYIIIYNWFYFGYDGKMYRNSAYKIDDKIYTFDFHGEMLKGYGWHVIFLVGEVYLSGDGTIKTNQWIYENGLWGQGNWYYVNHAGFKVKNDILKINGRIMMD